MKRAALHTALTVTTVVVCYLQAGRFLDLFDADKLTSLVHMLGVSVLVVLVPYFFIMLVDASGWTISFGPARKRITMVKLLMIRIATETLQASLPGGAAYAECARPYLLKQHFGLEYSQSITANIITKMNILLAQIIFLVCGLLFVVAQTSFVPGNSLSIVELCIVAIAVICFPLLLAYFLYRKNLLLVTAQLLQRSRLRIAAKILKKGNASILQVNRAISAFAYENRARLILSIGLFLLSWFLIAFESLVILKIIGIDVSISQVVIIESLISLVRIVFFFIPGAVGPQDVSLLFLFSLAGVPDPVNNSILFALLRRAKEFVWIVVGYGLLLVLGMRARNVFTGWGGELTEAGIVPVTSEARG